MLKFTFIIFFIIPLSIKSNLYWIINNCIFIIGGLFIILNIYNPIWSSIRYTFGCDTLSYGIIILTIWIISLILLAREKIKSSNNHTKFFITIIIILIIMLWFTFSTVNLFIFYLFFERSLIPTLFLILGWGYQPERLQAGLYLLFYTLLASLPLLIRIIYCYKSNYTLVFDLININYPYFLLYLRIITAFLVKIPIYLFHVWLPKAHVEAPISGSMILAGVLLKLGGYGLIRVIPIILKSIIIYNYIWVTISLVGGLLIRLICISQIDIKSLIAYSSVAHISIILRGLITQYNWGASISLTIIIAHGLCSSGLFCLANINYERVHRRRIIINKGIINFIPRLAIWWFLLRASNIACPPTINLIGEIGLLNSIINWSWISLFSISLLSFFRAAYSLYLFSLTQHGKIVITIHSHSPLTVREFLLIFLHWLPLNLLVIKREIIVLWL